MGQPLPYVSPSMGQESAHLEPAVGHLEARRHVSGRRRRVAIAAITVILVIMSSVFWMAEVWNERQWTPPPPDLFEGAYVFDEATFSGLSGVLTHGLRVGPTGSARIVDCGLTVYLEDLVSSYGALFEVEGGGSLSLVNTTVRVVADPNLTKAVRYEPGMWWTDAGHANPILARAINLMGAERPVLSLNVSWSQPATDLLVMGQRDGSSPFERLGTLRLPQLGPGKWTRLEYDLTPHRGSIIWLGLTPVAWNCQGFLVSDLKVTDGGFPLEGDSLVTGDPSRDGWYIQGFGSFQDRLLHQYWGGIVSSQGRLSLVSSSIQMPPGVPRLMTASIEDGDPVIGPGIENSNQILAPRNGEVAIQNGSLEMDSSSLVNVPVMCQDTMLSIADSTLAGEVDQLTVLRCGGTLERTTFVSVQPPPGTPVLTFDGDYRWALSADRAMAGVPLELRGCQFEGGEVAVDLDGADARVTGCEFRNVTRLALWDHEAIGLGGWGSVGTANSFVDCTGHRYLRTEACELDFVGPGVPSPEDAYGGSRTRVIEPVAPVLPDVRLVYSGALDASVMLPSVSVEGGGAVHAIGQLRIGIQPNWDGEVETTVAAGTRRADVVFNGTGDEDVTLEDYLARSDLVTWVTAPGPSPGDLAVDVEIHWEDLSDRYGVVIERAVVLLDAGPWAELELNTSSFNLSVPLALGPSEVTFVLNGTGPGWAGARGLWNQTWRYYRADASTSSAEVFAFLNATGGELLLDPGSDIVLEGPTPVGTEYGTNEWYLGVLGWDGGRVMVRDFQGNASSSISVSAAGRCTMTVQDVACGMAVFSAEGSRIQVSRLECGLLWPDGSEGGTLEIDNASVHGSIESFGFDRSNLTLVDSHVTIAENDWTWVGQFVYVEMGEGSVSILNTTFDSTLASEAYVELSRFSAARVRGCSFDGVSLHLPVWFSGDEVDEAERVTVDVQGCAFKGNGSYLVTETYNLGLNDTLSWTMAANEFVGPGAGLVLPLKGVRPSFASNVLVQGARAYQFYFLEVSAKAQPQGAEPSWLGTTAIVHDKVLPGGPEDLYQRSLLDQAYFVDVTDGPWPGADPVVLVMFTAYLPQFWLQGPVVVWFEDFSAGEMPLEVTVPGMPDIDRLVWDILSPLLGPEPV